MNRMRRTLTLLATVAGLALAGASGNALAGHGHHHKHHDHHRGCGHVVVAPPVRYYYPAPRVYYAPRPVYYSDYPRPRYHDDGGFGSISINYGFRF